MGTNKIRKLRTSPALLILAVYAGADPTQMTGGEPRVPRATAVQDSTLLSQAAQPQPSASPTPEQVQQMLSRFLTSDHASVTFEPKVNTIVVMDNESAIRRISTFLNTVDRPKHQISIQVRVLSINNTASKGTGLDWSNTLGPNGLSLNATAQANLNSLFGFDPTATWKAITNQGNSGRPGTPTSTSVTVGPVTITAILRALS